jgi:hypothetical protein
MDQHDYSRTVRVIPQQQTSIEAKTTFSCFWVSGIATISSVSKLEGNTREMRIIVAVKRLATARFGTDMASVSKRREAFHKDKVEISSMGIDVKCSDCASGRSSKGSRKE